MKEVGKEVVTGVGKEVVKEVGRRSERAALLRIPLGPLPPKCLPFSSYCCGSKE